MASKPLWEPCAQSIEHSAMTALMARLGADLGREIAGADALHAASVARPDAFWNAVWDHCAVIGDKGSEPWLLDADRMPGARFFPQARLNYAENLLRGRGDEPALIFRGEDGARRSVSWDALCDTVARLQRWLKAVGVKPGDRVAAMMPNTPETIIALLAAASLGAVWSSCSPDFGVQGVLDRFGQIEPKIFIACDGYRYAGKAISVADKLEHVLAAMPSVEQTLVVPYLGEADRLPAQLGRAVAWEAAVEGPAPGPPAFERLPFVHPLYILFSSGTTGVPKCIVHSAGGALLQHMKEHRFHCDLKAGERLFYFTTCGWMMWNWLVTGLASSATLLLYDGSPFHPSGNVLFDYADEEDMAVFGASAKYIDALRNAGLKPRDTHDLTAMRMMLSTGSPLVPEGFDFVYDAVKPDVHLASIAGGTDLVSCFVLGNPLKPVWRGEIQGAGLGMAVDVFDETGQPLKRGKGELVCVKPFPSMPVGFWNDPDGAKYHDAYFARFDNVWHHGDFAEWTEHGGMIIHGRSDATLNPGGVRIGTAEIYRQVEQLPEVAEALVIGQDWAGDVRIVLFVVLAEGVVLDEALRAAIRTRVREGASPRHVPAVIVAVGDIPRTKSGKITELAVRDIVHGRDVKNREALANPEALDLYRDLPALRA